MYKLYGQITREFLGLRMLNFQSIVLYEHEQKDFQICISVPLEASFLQVTASKNKTRNIEN